jgi:hypothetical protein
VFLRAQVVALRARGRSVVEIADGGREGLLDKRRHNGAVRADDWFRQTVASLLWQTPLDYDYSRPTWTRELLVRVAEEQTGIRVSVCTMGRVLRRRRLHAIETLVAELPDNQVAVYEDEVDIHFNPKVGLDCPA